MYRLMTDARTCLSYDGALRMPATMVVSLNQVLDLRDEAERRAAKAD